MINTKKYNISKSMKGKMPKFIPDNSGIVRTSENKYRSRRDMLEALKGEGSHLPGGFSLINFPGLMPAGYFIFIPDEEKDAD